MKRLVCGLLLWAAMCSAAERLPFRIGSPGEAEARFVVTSASGKPGLLELRLRGKPAHQVFVPAGARNLRLSAFLGALPPGEHVLEIEGGEQIKAASLEVRVAEAGSAAALALAHSPVLFARANTGGGFSDVPLISYCEQLTEDGSPLLQYSIVFSNEDGGTSTRALMARWGRATDIEYVYRVKLKRDGGVERATVQGPNHQELPFQGRFDGLHPLLIPVTDNNMVAGNGESAVRYQLVPLVTDLRERSRESVMDEHPFVYEVMARELEGEQRLRPFGQVDGEKISDARNYLFVDYDAALTTAAFAVEVRLKKQARTFSSDLGRLDYAIGREGWVRTAIELPPGSDASQIAEIGFRCMTGIAEGGRRLADSGTCRLRGISKMFFLDRSYLPGPSLLSKLPSTEVPSGQTAWFAVP